MRYFSDPNYDWPWNRSGPPGVSVVAFSVCVKPIHQSDVLRRCRGQCHRQYLRSGLCGAARLRGVPGLCGCGARGMPRRILGTPASRIRCLWKPHQVGPTPFLLSIRLRIKKVKLGSASNPVRREFFVCNRPKETPAKGRGLRLKRL
jgi:hypothetical protein